MKSLISTFAIMLATATLAGCSEADWDVSKEIELNAFVERLKSENAARAESAEGYLYGWIEDIHVGEDENGDKYSYISLGTPRKFGPLGNVILPPNLAHFYCLLPMDEAAKLEKRQKVSVHAELKEVRKGARPGANFESYEFMADCVVKVREPNGAPES